MMDLWHCHKPNEHDHGDGDAISTRGYSASSKLVSKSETGFVDVMSFLLMQADCTGVQVGCPLLLPPQRANPGQKRKVSSWFASRESTMEEP